MAIISTKVAVLLVLLQVSCCAVVSRAYTPAVNFPAVMTVNGFQKGEACDGQYHSDEEFIVSLSSEWFEGGARCGKQIRIEDPSNMYITATVVDECGDCDSEVGASAHIWRNFRLDPSLGEVNIRWSDFN